MISNLKLYMNVDTLPTTNSLMDVLQEAGPAFYSKDQVWVL